MLVSKISNGCLIGEVRSSVNALCDGMINDGCLIAEVRSAVNALRDGMISDECLMGEVQETIFVMVRSVIEAVLVNDLLIEEVQSVILVMSAIYNGGRKKLRGFCW